MKIQALHEFHNADFSKEWADKFEPTAPRIKLFETLLGQIESVGSPTLHILELGIGPGFLASYMLQRMPEISYEGLDFSDSMLAIAKERTMNYEDRISFLQADLIKEAWNTKITTPPQVIVSTWALHDLFEKKNILNVYKAAYELLPAGGLLLNGDFIKPETSTHEYEGGRIKPSEHIELLQLAGFQKPECIEEFEKSVENPTTSNNYACFHVRK